MVNMAKKHQTDYAWIKKAYTRYIVSFRKDTDADIIEFIESNKDDVGTTEIFRQAVRLLMETEK